MTTERVNNSPFAWAVQMLPGECCSYGQVHGRDESLPYQQHERESVGGPGMPGPYILLYGSQKIK